MAMDESNEKLENEKPGTENMAASEEAQSGGESQGLNNTRYRDSSGKTIFKDPILCSQFLRDYVDIPILKDVRPEDIEDVTERFIHMFTEERDADVVKKVTVKNNSFFVISLIEHKSDVDYNVVMQVLRYVAFIWEDYEKEQEKIKNGISKTQGFRYPPVLPIVFYDGIDNWTAATRLHERVFFSNVLGKYIPDYECLLVQLKDYSNAELMEKKNELSLIMLVEKLKNAADYGELGKELEKAYLTEAMKSSPQYLLKLMSQIIEVFLAKLNVPQEEAVAFTDRIKERKMGELFKHFEGWDIQAERRKTKEAQEKYQRLQNATKQQLDTYEATIAEKDSAIAEKDSAIAELKATIAKLQAEMQKEQKR